MILVTDVGTYMATSKLLPLNNEGGITTVQLNHDPTVDDINDMVDRLSNSDRVVVDSQNKLLLGKLSALSALQSANGQERVMEVYVYLPKSVTMATDAPDHPEEVHIEDSIVSAWKLARV